MSLPKPTRSRPRRVAGRPHRATYLVVALVILVCASPVAGGDLAWRLPAAARVVAMADWHGDLEAARRALRLGGAIDQDDRWIGGDLVVVQTGDVTDRGDQERAIIDLLARLRQEAAAAGGALVTLLGNHEAMNAAGDFRYVTDGGWLAFADLAGPLGVDVDPTLAELEPERRARAAALRPGGPYARLLAESRVVAIVGRDVFVHGGLTVEHVAYGLDRLNREAHAWLLGEGPAPAPLGHRDGPLWFRGYCREDHERACEQLEAVLTALDCDRIFMGHTIQAGGIAPGCDRRAWCLDTGAASHYGGPVQAVEITAAGVRVLD